MARNTNYMALADMLDGLDSLVDKKGSIKREDPLYRELRDLIYFNLLSDEGRESYQDFAARLHQSGENVDVSIPDAYKIAKQEKLIDTDAEDDLFSGLMDDDEFEEFQRMLESNPDGYKKWNGKTFYELALEGKDKQTGNAKRLLLARLFKEILNEDRKAPTKQSATKRVLRGKLVDF